MPPWVTEKRGLLRHRINTPEFQKDRSVAGAEGGRGEGSERVGNFPVVQSTVSRGMGDVSSGMSK